MAPDRPNSERSDVAGLAAERVEAIIAAAEEGAREIVEKAHAEAERIRAEAARELEELAARLRAVQIPEPERVREPEPLPEAEPEPEPEAESPKPKAAPVSPEGARLVALNMALSGTPREETARYLQEHFGIESSDDLLDDVYARAGS